MVGDFNSKSLIKKIDQSFSYMKKTDLKPYTFKPEKPIETPIVRNVIGPESERVMIGYRFPGSSSKDARMLVLLGYILSNGSAVLIYFHLVNTHKLFGASAEHYVSIYYR